MNKEELAVSYRNALHLHGTSQLEDNMARVCASLPPHMQEQAAAVWEGALLAEVTPGQLREVIEEGNWPLLASLADLSECGDLPWSGAVRSQRAYWAGRREPAPQGPGA